MEELAKMQMKVIEPYHMNSKYPQVEDLVRDSCILINKSQTDLIEEYVVKKNINKEIDENFLKLHLNSILKSVCALTYCFELDLPDEETLGEFLEQDISPIINADVILTLFNIQNCASNIALEYWTSADSEYGFDPSEMYDACMAILAGIKTLCDKYKIDFLDLIFV